MQPRLPATLCCLALAGAAHAAPSVERILSRYLKSCGGSAAWGKVKTIARSGVALPGFGDLALDAEAAAPGKWSFNLKLKNGTTLTHGSDGTAGWERSPSPRLLEPAQQIEESLLNDAFLARNLRRYFPRMALKGKEKNGDHEVWSVEAVTPQGNTNTLYFDTRTGFLTRAGRATFGEYRDAGGVKLPFLIRSGAETFHYASAKLNGPVDEAGFRAPDVLKAAPAKDLPGAGTIMDRYIAAVGGREAFQKLRTQVRKGAIREGNEVFEMETFAKSPGKWLLKFSAGGNLLDTQGCDGAAGWQARGKDVKELSAHDRAEAEGIVTFDLPVLMSEPRVALSVKGRAKVDAREVYVVEAEIRGRRSTLRFDTETGLLNSMDSTGFPEYRDVDGVKVPSKMTIAGGRLTVEFTAISHNVPLDNGIFSRPAGSLSNAKAVEGLENAASVAVLRQAFGQGVTPSDGRMLYDLILEKGYKRALDIGTAHGYSALWFALAMKKNGGTVVTIEIDPEVADKARVNFSKAELDSVIDSRINDALLEIPAMKGTFDFVFLDPGAPINKELFDLLRHRIAPRGTLAAHNAASFKSAQPEFLKAIQTDPDLETGIVDTASGGISISTRR